MHLERGCLRSVYTSGFEFIFILQQVQKSSGERGALQAVSELFAERPASSPGGWSWANCHWCVRREKKKSLGRKGGGGRSPQSRLLSCLVLSRILVSLHWCSWITSRKLLGCDSALKQSSWPFLSAFLSFALTGWGEMFGNK